MMGLSELKGAGSSSSKKGIFDFLKGSNSNKARSRASISFGPSVGSGTNEKKAMSRRLSMPGLASLASNRSQRASKGSKSRGKDGSGGSGGDGSAGGAEPGGHQPFVIKHPRYGRREYAHHFVPLTVVVATWNVGGHNVSYSDLSGLKKWLLESLPAMPDAVQPQTGMPGSQKSSNTQQTRLSVSDSSLYARNCPDMYVLGLQEIVDFNTKNVVLSNEESQNRAREWLDILQCILPREHKYQLLTSKSMVGIFLCVFVKESKVSGMSAVRATNVGVGLLGKGGNKGAVGVSVRYGCSTLCFMTAHLAAHRDNVEGRCSDFKNIVARMDFRSQRSNNADIGSKGNEWCVVRKCPLYASIGSKSKELRQLELGETLTEMQRVLKKDGRLWIQFKDGWCPTKSRGLVGDKLIVLRSDEKTLAAGSSSGQSDDPTSPSVAAGSNSAQNIKVSGYLSCQMPGLEIFYGMHAMLFHF